MLFNPYPVNLKTAVVAFQDVYPVALSTPKTTLQTLLAQSEQQLDRSLDQLVQCAEDGVGDLYGLMQQLLEDYARHFALQVGLPVENMAVLRFQSTPQVSTLEILLEEKYQWLTHTVLVAQQSFYARQASEVKQDLRDARQDCRSSLQLAATMVSTTSAKGAPTPVSRSSRSVVLWLMLSLCIAFLLLTFGSAIFLGFFLHP